MDVAESVIRLMTRLAVQHQAVNLSQGFVDESPEYELVWGGIAAMLGGTDEHIGRLEKATLEQLCEEMGSSIEDFLGLHLKDLLAHLQNPHDQLNQYSYPFGLPELRRAIADYTARFCGFRPDPETEVTVVLGATEGLASTLRAVCTPGDGVIIFQPFHEMYPSQVQMFDLRPEYVTLRENRASNKWDLDREEIADAAKRNIKVLILNTPHNPTGKVFSEDELHFIADLCKREDILVITDEIYEHIVYDDHRHLCLATLDGMRERTIVVNSISKTGNATGWRIGWVISPTTYTPMIRGIHDTLVIQAPTPLQKGAIHLLDMDDVFYKGIRRAYKDKCELLIDGLQRVGFRVSPPEGSYYLLADYSEVPALKDRSPMEAAMLLIEEIGVAAVPGDNFYNTGKEEENRYMRFAFCRSLNMLQEATRRLASLGPPSCLH